MSQFAVQSILFQFSKLFLLCKCLGIYPYNLQTFQQYRELKKSTIGTIYTLLSMFVIIVLYNWLIYSISGEDTTLKTSQSTLTFVIGIFLTYIGLIMMATDQLTAIRNQKKVGRVYERIRIVDERLLNEGCTIDNRKLNKHINVLLILVFMTEIIIMLASYIILIEHTNWKTLLWIFSSFPTLYNSLDKIWFAITLKALQQRFLAINTALCEMVEEHERYKLFSLDFKNEKEQFLHEENLNFLYTELAGGAANDIGKLKRGKNRIIPVAAVATNFKNYNDLSGERSGQKNIQRESLLNNFIKVEEKFNNFCQIHDELCEIGRILNELWSYPILVLMAYGFLIFTAQLYFLYCATQGQDIPSLFLSAKNAYITALFLFYTAGKCTYLIYLSYKTSLESKCTGICLHKCGVVADNNDLYEIINHLSLKLLNHSVDFSACGFFALNMETLYGISGGITSYLIILIQFNLAAQQAKEASITRHTSEMSLEEQRETNGRLEGIVSSTISTALSSVKK